MSLGSPGGTSKTGLAWDPVMLQHACLCGDEVLHPESPGRVERILDKLQEAGLVPRYTQGEDFQKKNVLHVGLFVWGS